MLGILEIRNGEIFLMSNDNIFLSHKSLCVTFNIVLLAFYFPPALLSLHYGQIFHIYIYIFTVVVLLRRAKFLLSFLKDQNTKQ